MADGHAAVFRRWFSVLGDVESASGALRAAKDVDEEPANGGFTCGVGNFEVDVLEKNERHVG